MTDEKNVIKKRWVKNIVLHIDFVTYAQDLSNYTTIDNEYYCKYQIKRRMRITEFTKLTDDKMFEMEVLIVILRQQSFFELDLSNGTKKLCYVKPGKTFQCFSVVL